MFVDLLVSVVGCSARMSLFCFVGSAINNDGSGRIVAETVTAVATDAAVIEEEQLMTLEALRERNRAR